MVCLPAPRDCGAGAGAGGRWARPRRGRARAWGGQPRPEGPLACRGSPLELRRSLRGRSACPGPSRTSFFSSIADGAFWRGGRWHRRGSTVYRPAFGLRREPPRSAARDHRGLLDGPHRVRQAIMRRGLHVEVAGRPEFEYPCGWPPGEGTTLVRPGAPVDENMLAKRIIPCLDVKDGRVVKGVNFVGLRDAGDPVECAKRYDDEGADEITFLDITASHEKRAIILDVVARTAEACSRRSPWGRRSVDRPHPTLATRGRRQGVDQHRRGARARARAARADALGQPGDRRGHRRPPAARNRPTSAVVGGVHPRRAHADRSRRRRLGRDHGAKRRR